MFNSDINIFPKYVEFSVVMLNVLKAVQYHAIVDYSAADGADGWRRRPRLSGIQCLRFNSHDCFTA